MCRNNLIQIINKEMNNNTAKRLGTIFDTGNSSYFYDTGTGKVITLDKESKHILSSILKSTNDSIEKIDTDRNYLNYFLDFIEQENLLQAIEPRSFSHQNHSKFKLEKILNNEMEQLILKVTGRCNFRCKYCIYNEEFQHNCNFENEDMSSEMAKKAVDFYYDHSSNSKYTAITFYGGEPLIKFDLIKEVIDYSIYKFRDRSNMLSFSLTSNLSLITEEMIDYFISVPNFNLVCSLDGDRESQNSYRQFADGTNTFEVVFEKFKLICDKANKEPDSSFSLSANMVFTPPYTFEKLDRVNNFYSSLNFLPKDFSIMITYPDEGSLDDGCFLQTLKDDDRYIKYFVNESDLVYSDPLQQWSEEKTMKNKGLDSNNKNNLYFNYIKSQLIRINTRYISDNVSANYPFNGCCLPGMRRLYVDTKGVFYPCERVGKSPSIGNIDDGLDYESIEKYYINEYESCSLKYCQNCWAIRLCGTCYAVNMLENGIDKDYHEKKCDLNRLRIKNQLAFYHEALEKELDFSILKDEFLY